MSEPMVEQGTEAWRRLRCGKITASQFKNVIRDDGEAPQPAARIGYMRALAFERLSGQPVHEISSRSLAWGKTHEATARTEFEIRRGVVTSQVDFIVHPDMPFVGCSPDGLIDDLAIGESGIEVKCPHSEAIHLRTWDFGMPSDHVPQVQGEMFVTNRRRWEFLSYDDRLGDSPLALYHQTVPRDEGFCRALEAALWQFELELRDMVERLRGKSESMWRAAA